MGWVEVAEYGVPPPPPHTHTHPVPLAQVHSKNTRVSVTRKGVHWGHTPFRVNSDPECGQLSADLINKGVRLTQLWVIFRVKLTDFRVIVDPEWILAPMDPFPGQV